MLSNIDIVIKGDYEWNWEEQEYQEQIIDNFRYQFSKWLDSCSIRTATVIAFNISYLPEYRKFRIDAISNYEDKIITAIKEDRKFNSTYFIW